MKKLLFVSCLFVLLMACVFGAGELPVFSQPVMITTAGQSAGAAMMKVLFSKSAVKEYVFEKLVDQTQMQGYKTLVIVVGLSSKGLGAAGIDQDKEIERIQGLVKVAKESGMKILVAQIEGMVRRGVGSDQLINLFVPISDIVIIIREADSDSLFTQLCTKGNIPLIIVEKSVEIAAQLNKIFGK